MLYDYLFIYLFIYMYIFLYIYTHMHTHAYIYIYIYIGLEASYRDFMGGFWFQDFAVRLQECGLGLRANKLNCKLKV